MTNDLEISQNNVPSFWNQYKYVLIGYILTIFGTSCICINILLASLLVLLSSVLSCICTISSYRRHASGITMFALVLNIIGLILLGLFVAVCGVGYGIMQLMQSDYPQYNEFMFALKILKMYGWICFGIIGVISALFCAIYNCILFSKNDKLRTIMLNVCFIVICSIILGGAFIGREFNKAVLCSLVIIGICVVTYFYARFLLNAFKKTTHAMRYSTHPCDKVALLNIYSAIMVLFYVPYYILHLLYTIYHVVVR